MKSLFECFSSVPDHRMDSGKRYSMSTMLTLITLSYMCNHYSMQSVRRFFVNNKEELTAMFDLKHGVPSYTQVRIFLMDLDFEALNKVFLQWIQTTVQCDGKQWLALDGKCLGSTLKDYSSKAQSYQSMVGAFMFKSGITVGYKKYDNGKEGEAQKVRDLISELEDNKYIITLDALHCEKKLYAVS